jgi:hypothetical protein
VHNFSIFIAVLLAVLTVVCFIFLLFEDTSNNDNGVRTRFLTALATAVLASATCCLAYYAKAGLNAERAATTTRPVEGK